MSKSNHKHKYFLLLVQYKSGEDYYNLVQRCEICGKEKPANYKLIFHKENGYMKMLTSKEDFEEIYGILPVREWI